MAKKRADAFDRQVGVRVRMRRLMIKMSQQQLAAGLGVSFQQVQKYENGTNRMGTSRLRRLAEILQVPVSFSLKISPCVEESRRRCPRTCRIFSPAVTDWP